MSKFEEIDFDWVISLITQQIATDIMVQDGAIKNLHNMVLLEKGIRCSQLHVRLLQSILQLKVVLASELKSSSGLMSVLASLESSLTDDTQVVIERRRSFLSVMSDERLLGSCLRIIMLLLLQEDNRLKRVLIGTRSRSGYVSIRLVGGRVRSGQLLTKEIVQLLARVIHLSMGYVDWCSRAGKRVVYIRLKLSSQLNLMERIHD